MDRRCTTHRKHAKTADTGANTKNGGKKLQRTRDSIDIMPTAPLTSGRTRSFRERGSKDPRGITHEKRGIITRTLSMKAITPTVPPASRRREGKRTKGGGRLQGKTTHTYRGESDGTRRRKDNGKGGPQSNSNVTMLHDVAEMWQSCGRDVADMWQRCGRDVAEMWL